MMRRGALAALAALGLSAAFGATGQAIRWRAFGADSEAAIRRGSAGQPFVLAFWSADCPPCRDELVLWASGQARHPALRIVLVCTDYGEELDRANAMLRQAGAGALEHWAFADPVAERVRWGVDPGWRGELPMARFYDRAHRVTVHRGRLDAVTLEAMLARLAGRGA